MRKVVSFGIASRFVFYVMLFLFFHMAGPAGAAAGKPSFTVISPGTPPPVIVVGAAASASEKFAAQELALYLGKITGRTFKVSDDAHIPKGRLIAIGKSKLTSAIDIKPLEIEQFITDVTPSRLVIIGGRRPTLPGGIVRDRGTLYGVYEFLDSLGVRWYRPEEWGEFVPRMDRIELPPGRTTSRPPAYWMRSGLAGGFTRYRETTPEMQQRAELWAVRNHLNWNESGGDPKFGGQVSYTFEHVYFQMFPDSEYFKAHPEYFSLINGKRTSGLENRPSWDSHVPQLCLGNTELQDEFARKVIEKAKAHPNWDSITIMPNDSNAWCECPLCKAMDDPRNPANMSNRLCAFNNIIGRKVAAEAPAVKLHWLAYADFTAVPTIVHRLHPNAIIQLTTINEWNDYSKKLDHPGSNANFVAAAKGWSAMQPAALMTYEYWSGYGWAGPLPLTRIMADRLRNYREYKIRGIYNESYPSWGPQGMDLYMFSRLIWNPDLDLDRELNLYYKNYYGPAAGPMKAYHETLMDALDKCPFEVRSGGRGMHLLMTPALVEKLGENIAAAEALVKDQPFYARRVHGVALGQEFSRRVCELLRLKKADGVPTTGGSSEPYLKSVKADAAWADLKEFLLSFNKGDAVFDVTEKDRTNKIAETGFMCYMPMDLLHNDSFAYRPEASLLAEF